MNDDDHKGNAFISRLTSIVEENLGDENFGVNELADKMQMNRSSIHRKLKSITKKPVSQFIREIRLNKALELLRQTDLHVSEISYGVGFSSPTYFNTCFHKHFGYPPGEAKGTEPNGNLSPKESTAQLNVSEKTKYFRIIYVLPVVVVALLVILVFYNTVVNHHSNELSIIVLPFKNLSDDRNNEYFADGIREDILNNLYRMSSLRVVSNTTAENFRGNNLTAREIAHQMNVYYVLEGSVRRYGDKVRISIQLIDAKKDDHLWSDNFDREMKKHHSGAE